MYLLSEDNGSLIEHTVLTAAVCELCVSHTAHVEQTLDYPTGLWKMNVDLYRGLI